MALEVLQHATFTGPALPEPYVRYEMEKDLQRLKLIPGASGKEREELQKSWAVYRRILRELVAQGGAVRVRNHVLEPLIPRLGYCNLEEADAIETREGSESGGFLFTAKEGERLRVWTTALGEDLDAPAKRGRAYRFSNVRIAQRVLLASAERIGLITNGLSLRILISDPSRPDSQIEIPVDPHWKRSSEVPDSYRLLLALASPEGVKALPELTEKARLYQTRVTRELRVQARQAIERFIQGILDHPDNHYRISQIQDKEKLARELWREGLAIIYRLLFIFKLEGSDDPARAFSFSSTSLWRNSFSPGMALARHVREILDHGAETGRYLEEGLRALFRMFSDGLQCTELIIKPMGGALFSPGATPLLNELRWGERATANLLDWLLWTTKQRGAASRERVHYGSLDVEDLGRVYEALLELEPGIATETMCRLRRQKLEVVVKEEQGRRYRPSSVSQETADVSHDNESEDDDTEDDEEEEPKAYGKKTKVEWIEEIHTGRFYLRVGLGRKSTGSYYTPHSFVRFLVQETLGPQVAARSPYENPNPASILTLKVLDPAMGSGHFLVEACRFLGEKLYEACRLCDEKATDSERRSEKSRDEKEKSAFLEEANAWRQRIIELPDPDDELLRYLPSRAPEGGESGYSQKMAEALCRRLAAVHCLYGVDKNPLAVELAKLSIWLESQSEGMPLTFLDHRFAVGDSLTGPFFEHLLKFPGSQDPMDDMLTEGIREKLSKALTEAITDVEDLEAAFGIDLSEMEAKRAAKERLEKALAPFKIAAAAWAGGVMLGPGKCDDMAYANLLRDIAGEGRISDDLREEPELCRMIARGLGLDEASSTWDELMERSAPGKGIPALPYDLTFPEVFYPDGSLAERRGFDVVLGNPPWEGIKYSTKEFLASFDLDVLNAPTKRERERISSHLLKVPRIEALLAGYIEDVEMKKRTNDTYYEYQKILIDDDLAGRNLDLFRVFLERAYQATGSGGLIGMIVPDGFHTNAGAAAIRKLFLTEMSVISCYSFRNLKKLFEISAGKSFDLVVSKKETCSSSFSCAFALEDPGVLFSKDFKPLKYSNEMLVKAGGDYYSILELRSEEELKILEKIYSKQTVEKYCTHRQIEFKSCPNVLHMSHDSYRLEDTANIPRDGDAREWGTMIGLMSRGFVPLHEKGTIEAYNDRLQSSPRYLVKLSEMHDRRSLINNARFYRLIFRSTIHAGEILKSVFCLIPPGGLAGNSTSIETSGAGRKIYNALIFLACMNSFVENFAAIRAIVLNLNLFIFWRLPFPHTDCSSEPFFAHSAIRLTCNHSGYEPLWREQVGDAWREPKAPFTWPVLEGDDARWEVRAAIDAVVADAYGLSREQYEHILSTFSHRSYPKAPDLCLARFDEMKSIGLAAFAKKHDPYWDIPLNESLPKPVIDIPLPAASTAHSEQLSLLGDEPEPPARKKKKAGRRVPFLPKE
jgi:hypothetical protein